jgi:hypothetical protein
MKVTSLRQKYINNEKLKCLIEIQRRNSLRDRSLFIVQGGIEEKLGGSLKFFKTWKGGLWKNTERRKKGGFENIYQFEKH